MSLLSDIAQKGFQIGFLSSVFPANEREHLKEGTNSLNQTNRIMKQPSKERGCEGKMQIKKQPAKKARFMSKKHGKRYGVYLCPHCDSHHLTTNLHSGDKYAPLIYVTPIPIKLNQTK